MMRIFFTFIAALCTVLASPLALADPFVATLNPYPSTVVQPASAYYTVNGGATQTACAIETVTGGKRPKCDMSSLTSNGDYTIVVTVCSAPGGIANDTGGGGATVTTAGCASSGPFSYRLRGGAIGSPGGLQAIP